MTGLKVLGNKLTMEIYLPIQAGYYNIHKVISTDQNKNM